VQEGLDNCGKSTIANARGQLAQLRAGKKGEQVEQLLQREVPAKITFFCKILFMTNFANLAAREAVK
jgi:hypothetical protein